MVINEVEVDPQLPHALESIFKSETETNKTFKLIQINSNQVHLNSVPNFFSTNLK